ncbi:hypothetical protein [Variovorax sp. PAMC 28711]|uniref:hypothetical protein n=1 Tax=Variovorax sp. PAMC 28711 TaxID=1795631 RepID=UPI000B27636D|nr:hypothetical protein [Variovorax sp. PAMC 28711]
MNDFLTTPLTFTRDQRTSRQVCRDACAIEGFKRRAPLHERILVRVPRAGDRPPHFLPLQLRFT